MSRSVRYSKYTVGPLVASALAGITALGTPSCAEDLVDRTPVLVRGVVVDAEEGVPLEESEGLEGVVVCVHPQSEKSNYGDCVKTAANGEFELPNVPHNANVLIKFCATEQCKVPGVGSDGLIPTIRMIHTTDNDELIMVIRTPMRSAGDPARSRWYPHNEPGRATAAPSARRDAARRRACRRGAYKHRGDGH